MQENREINIWKADRLVSESGRGGISDIPSVRTQETKKIGKKF
jgi:hypothetical protein